MTLSRRRALALGGAAITVSLIPARFALADADQTKAEIDAFTGGLTPLEEGVTLTIPELVENGNMVPLTVEAPGASTIVIYGEDNPIPEIIRFEFGELAGSTQASVRIRLARTQNVIAVAQMEDGTFRIAARQVKVTIGGCGA